MTSWQKYCHSIVFTALVVLNGLPAFAQHSHKQQEGMTWERPARVVRLQLVVLPDSGVVKGRLELEYANQWDVPLDQIVFRLPPGAIIEIDSVLYLNSPLVPEEIERSDSLLILRLAQVLNPGERGFVMMTYSAKLTELPDADAWSNGVDLWGTWPVLCRQKSDKGVWLTDFDLGARCDYDVAVTLDTSYILAHSGTLLDERQVYGLLSTVNDGESVTDLQAVRDSLPGLREFVPIHESGSRQYFVRSRGTRGMSLVVGRELVLDRVNIDSTVVTIYRPRGSGERVATIVRMMLPALMERMGRSDDTVLSIVVAEGIRQSVWQAGAVLLPVAMVDDATVDAAVAFGLAQRFVHMPESYATPDGLCRRNGAAYFVAADVLFGLHGVDGYRLVTDYEDRLLRLRGEEELSRYGCTSQTLPLVWQEAIYWYSWSRAEESTVPYPVWQAIELGDAATSGATDYQFQNNPTGAGFVRVRANVPRALPPQLGAVRAGQTDTVYVYPEGATSDTVWVYYIEEDGPVTAIIIDPHYDLYDIDRSNNYWYKFPRRTQYRLPDDVFPALRRLQ